MQRTPNPVATAGGPRQEAKAQVPALTRGSEIELEVGGKYHVYAFTTGTDKSHRVTVKDSSGNDAISPLENLEPSKHGRSDLGVGVIDVAGSGKVAKYIVQVFQGKRGSEPDKEQKTGESVQEPADPKGPKVVTVSTKRVVVIVRGD